MPSKFSEEDLSFMRRALQLAEHAARLGEVPVGAVLVENGLIIGEGWNAPICNHDASHHAEVAAIRDACRAVHNGFLTQLFMSPWSHVLCASVRSSMPALDALYLRQKNREQGFWSHSYNCLRPRSITITLQFKVACAQMNRPAF